MEEKIEKNIVDVAFKFYEMLANKKGKNYEE